ncbi:MAG: glycosyltransferase family 2 protein [Chloroflexota bacterium]|nr:glycosyltransferase family 2 protein [Chloroflexota bacterium]
MELGIAIVSYNTRDLTAGCLASVYQEMETSGLCGQVWVVDNASKDGSAEMVKARFPQTHLVANEENVGFARATNMAIAQMKASGNLPEYVLLLNPDTRVRPGALVRMASFLESHPRVAVVGPRLTYGDGTFQHSAFHFPTLLMAFLDFWPLHHQLLDSRLNGRYPKRLYEAGKPFSIDHPLGAAMMVRKETIQEVGLLDDEYFMYCEEIDWCKRIKEAGWEIYCLPSAEIVHFAAQSTRQFAEEMFVALWRSRYRLFQKHYGRAYRVAARLIVRAGLWYKMWLLKRERRQGELSRGEMERKRAAYRHIAELEM